MKKFQYFAYGSNVLLERLRERCPSSTAIAPACARDWGITFTKRGRDGSGKATLVRADSAKLDAFGMIYDIDVAEGVDLDAAEGYGYDRVDNFQVHNAIDGTSRKVVTYIARDDAIVQHLHPFDWYLALVIAGAIQNKLQCDHVTNLRKLPAVLDTKLMRSGRLLAMSALAKSGYLNLFANLSSPRSHRL